MAAVPNVPNQIANPPNNQDIPNNQNVPNNQDIPNNQDVPHNQNVPNDQHVTIGNVNPLANANPANAILGTNVLNVGAQVPTQDQNAVIQNLPTLHDFITLDQLLQLQSLKASTGKPVRPTCTFSGDIAIAKAKGLTVVQEWEQLKSQMLSYLQTINVTNHNSYVPYFFSQLQGHAFAHYNAEYQSRGHAHLSWEEFQLHMNMLVKGTQESTHSVIARLTSFNLQDKAKLDSTPQLYTYLAEFRRDCALLPPETPQLLFCGWLVQALPIPLRWQFALDGTAPWNDLSKLCNLLLMHASSFTEFFASTKRAQDQQTINAITTPVPYNHVADAPGPPVFSGPSSSTSAPPTTPALPSNITIYTQPATLSNINAPAAPRNTWKRSNQAPPSAPPPKVPRTQANTTTYPPPPPPPPPFYYRLHTPRGWDPATVVPPHHRYPHFAPRTKPHVAGVTTNEAKLNELASERKCYVCKSVGHNLVACPAREQAFRDGTFFYYPTWYIPRN